MDVMEIEDDVYLNKNLIMEGLIPRALQRHKRCSRCWTVSLGLLCAALLAGNIGQIIHYEILSRPPSADPTQAGLGAQVDRLQSGDEALTAERRRCKARLSNATEDVDRLQQRLGSLTVERGQLKTGLDKARSERDRARASYNASQRAADKLQASYGDVQRNLRVLQSDYSNVTGSKRQLQIRCADLGRENSEMQTSFRQLQRNFSSLRRDRDQLQTRYDDLRREKEQLQTNYSSLVADPRRLQQMMDVIRRGSCPNGWESFNTSCYFISTVKKNWMSSRQDCIANGADLVVINSKDEQVFIIGMMTTGLSAWIGLTDGLDEGHWTWVDQTPFAMAYWQPGQPNNYKGNQDCGELVAKSADGEWTDVGCAAEQMWICEKLDPSDLH